MAYAEKGHAPARREPQAPASVHHLLTEHDPQILDVQPPDRFAPQLADRGDEPGRVSRRVTLDFLERLFAASVMAPLSSGDTRRAGMRSSPVADRRNPRRATRGRRS